MKMLLKSSLQINYVKNYKEISIGKIRGVLPSKIN
jgi:hypothetical protein